MYYRSDKIKDAKLYTIHKGMLSLEKEVNDKTKVASAGNRTRAARVAGEHSTTEPPMLAVYVKLYRYVSLSKIT